MIVKRDIIKQLSAIPGRGAGTAAERQAAEAAAGLFRSIGLEARLEPFRAVASMPLIHLVHFFPLFLICLFVNRGPLVASILGIVVIASFWGEFTQQFFLLRWLLPRRPSQNVVATCGRPDAPLKVVFSAHIDAARGGAVFHPRFAHVAGRLKRQPLHRTIFALMILLTGIFVIKAFGGKTWFLSLCFNSTAVLAFTACLVMAEWERAPFVAGANDDLSGVAVVLGLAEAIAKAPPDDIEFLFVVTGSEESHCNGMRAFLTENRARLPKEATYFINLECVGGGRLTYVTEEGFIILKRHHHTLIQLFETLATRRGVAIAPTFTVAHSDSIVPLVEGYKSIGIIALDDHCVPLRYHTREDVEAAIDDAVLDGAQGALLRMVDLLREFRRLEII